MSSEVIERTGPKACSWLVDGLVFRLRLGVRGIAEAAAVRPLPIPPRAIRPV